MNFPLELFTKASKVAEVKTFFTNQSISILSTKSIACAHAHRPASVSYLPAGLNSRFLGGFEKIIKNRVI
jgi:hypothetical protein